MTAATQNSRLPIASCGLPTRAPRQPQIVRHFTAVVEKRVHPDVRLPRADGQLDAVGLDGIGDDAAFQGKEPDTRDASEVWPARLTSARATGHAPVTRAVA